jgi:glycosyltransferase involved in cell wall biosynthesis
VAVAPRECDVVSIGERSGFSISADPDDPAEFAASVRQLIKDPDRLRKMGELARRAAPEYERGEQLKKFVSILERARVGTRPGR